MKGRTQAILVSVLGVGTLFFAWIGAAAVGLVTLRQGARQGFVVLAWAVLPASVILVMGRDVGPLASLIGVAFAATVLRATVSLPMALLASTASGVVTAIMMLTLGEAQMAAIMEVLQQFINSVQTQSVQNGANAEMVQKIAVPSNADVAGLIGISNAISVAISLMLARWWQALLYNPGGFQQEFHQLRFTPIFSVGLFVTALILANAGEQFRVWVYFPLIPLMFAGFGLVHGAVGKKGLPRGALVFAYGLWLMLDPARILLVLATIADSFVDFRSRLASGK